MSLVFAGILPNNSADDTASAGVIADAIHELEGELYCMKPDTLVVLVPQKKTDTEKLYQASIAATIHDDENHQWNTDVEFIVHVKEVFDTKHQSLLNISAEETVDNATATVLNQLTAHVPQVSIVIISTPPVSPESQQTFGAALRHEMQLTNKRMAIVATGALQPGESALNATLNTCITQFNDRGMTTLRPELIEHSQSTLPNPLVTLLGVVHGMGCHLQLLGGGKLPSHLPVVQIVLQ